MRIMDNEESATPEASPEVTLRPAQIETLRALLDRYNTFNNKVQPELKRLTSSFNDFLNYVRVDLGVSEGYRLTEDLTRFVLIEQPKADAAAESTEAA